MTSPNPLASQGAVTGANISTAPATTKATIAGAGGTLAGIAAFLYSLLAKNPTVIHWVGMLTGGGVTGASILGTQWAHISGLIAEARHATSTAVAQVAKVDPGLTPEVIDGIVTRIVDEVTKNLPSAVQTEISKQLAALIIPATPPAPVVAAAQAAQPAAPAAAAPPAATA